MSAAFIPPVDLVELPPTRLSFSTRTTFLPAWAAVMAAVMPAPPAPTTTTSASLVLGVLVLVLEPPGTRVEGSTPAAFSAASTASMTPLLA